MMSRAGKRANERLLVANEEEAADIRRDIRAGKISFEDAAAMIDLIALGRTMDDVRDDLRTQGQIAGQPLGWIDRK